MRDRALAIHGAFEVAPPSRPKAIAAFVYSFDNDFSRVTIVSTRANGYMVRDQDRLPLRIGMSKIDAHLRGLDGIVKSTQGKMLGKIARDCARG